LYFGLTPVFFSVKGLANHSQVSQLFLDLSEISRRVRVLHRISWQKFLEIQIGFSLNNFATLLPLVYNLFLFNGNMGDEMIVWPYDSLETTFRIAVVLIF
jgi:hypothetical protein